MTSYKTIDYLPDLTSSAMSAAIPLFFKNYTPTLASNPWDRSAVYSTSNSYALLNSTFSWTGQKGATYDIFSTSYFDPYLIQVYDNLGNVIATDTEGTFDTYGEDYVWEFVAPYSGTYYVSAGWHQGSASSNKYVSLKIFEDNDTASPTPPPVDAAPPIAITFNPTDEAGVVAVGSNVVVSFSEAIARGTGNIVLKTGVGEIIATYDAATSNNIAISGNTLTLNPTADLAYSSVYKVEFAAGSIKDLAGNSYAGTTSYNFTTESSPNIQGTLGSDTLIGGSGKPIDGLAGIDTVTYTGNRGSISHNSDGTWTVGTDTLTNIERLQFSDKKVALDVTDNALETLQFIGVIAPTLQSNLNVRGTILSLFDLGKSMQELCQFALDLGLITSDNNALAKTVFKNIFNTSADPDQTMTNALVGFIEQNGDAKFLATVAGLNINVDLVGLQQHGMEFI